MRTGSPHCVGIRAWKAGHWGFEMFCIKSNAVWNSFITKRLSQWREQNHFSRVTHPAGDKVAVV